MRHPIDLYELLPAVYRIEDARLGHPLRALLDIVSGEAAHVQRNITDLWDDFFVETADDWALPYIGDLLGIGPLHPVAGSMRADIAKAIGFRRRKGTVAMLEEMAADVTGWGARVVTFFELLEWGQNLNHLRASPAGAAGRRNRVGTVNLGDIDALDRTDGPFDEIAHSVDVRPFGAGRGRHNIKKIGFFLYRLQSNPLTAVMPRRADRRWRYWFSPLGNRAPLFTDERQPPGRARPVEADLPAPIRRLALLLDLEQAGPQASSRYYGPERHHSLAVGVGDADQAGDFGGPGFPVFDAGEVTVCDLSTWRRPTTGKNVAVDPVLGRLTLSADAEPGAGQEVRVKLNYGFSGGVGGDLGGGPYDRLASLARAEEEFLAGGVDPHRVAVATVRLAEIPAALPWTASIRDAVEDWLADPGRAPRAVVDVYDSSTYVESLDVTLPAGHALEIRARDGHRPVIDARRFVLRGGADTSVSLNGLVVMGAPVSIATGLAALTLRHCTVVPGREFGADGEQRRPRAASIRATGSATGCAVTLAHSIVGPVRLPEEGFTLTATDSIVDNPSGGLAIGGRGGGSGPTCDLRRLTVFGDVRVRSLGYASGVVFTGSVDVERTQTGCVRFSYVRDDAVTPKRFRCQPDLALEAVTGPAERDDERSRLTPRFTSRRYGDPGYAQLATGAAEELESGGEDEAEMGAFNALREPQRIANLMLRLNEYLPAGLEAGLIFET